MKVKNFTELIVWQKAMDLVDEVYGIVRGFPAEEKYALGDQLRRAVVSVPSNIAEGSGRETTKDFAHFLSIARGSLYEVMTQLKIAERQGFIEDISEVNKMISEISRWLIRDCRLGICERAGRELSGREFRDLKGCW